MTEADWLAGTDPAQMIEFVRDTATDRKMRLLAVACCRSSRQLLLNKNHRAGLDAAERHADGFLTLAELREVGERCNARAVAMYGQTELERDIHRWAEATAVANATHPPGGNYFDLANNALDAIWMLNRAIHRDINPGLSHLVRDVLGNPFRSVALDPSCRTEVVVALATGIYEGRAFERLPVLADALEDAGGADADVLGHCRGGGPHARGCWVVDRILGKV